jgi:LPXTG-motif cell wall-anchored protein
MKEFSDHIKNSVMKLELHGMGFTLPGISTDPLKTVTINDPIKPVTYVPTTTQTKLPLSTRILNTITKTSDVITQVVNPGAPQQATQYQTSYNPAEPPPQPQEDNTALYLALGGGALAIGILAAVILKKKKKKRGMGRVRSRATKSKNRAPRKRTVTRSRKRKATKRKTSKRRR